MSKRTMTAAASRLLADAQCSLAEALASDWPIAAKAHVERALKQVHDATEVLGHVRYLEDDVAPNRDRANTDG